MATEAGDGSRLQPRVRLRDLHPRDWARIVVGAVKSSFADHVTLLASGLAYSSFLAIPSLLLVVVGVFTLTTSASAIDGLMQALQGAIPEQALALLGDSLRQLDRQQHTGGVLVVGGTLLALWFLTSAMSGFITAIMLAYRQRESRSFFRRRLVAFELVICFLLALTLVGTLLVFGPTISGWIGRRTNAETTVNWLWWAGQWPLLAGALLAVLTAMLWLAPERRPSWQVLLPGALLATVIWMAASGLFALYTATFDSYNKTWGSLSAVIVTLVWLWLSALALLLGAELNAEADRYRSGTSPSGTAHAP
jgi:membrane protein